MRETKKLKIIIVGLLLGCSLSTSAEAAQEKSTDALLAGELRSLSASINNLAARLGNSAGEAGQDTTLRKLDIAIAYLNFRSRRIEMFERDLQSMRSSRNRLEDMLGQLRQEEENLVQAFGNSPHDVMQQAKEDMAFRRKVIRDRIERFDSEIIMVENKVLDMQSQIERVEDYVQKNLKF